MLLYSNHKGMPNNVNIYFHDNKWLLETVWKTTVFPSLDSLLASMVRQGICNEQKSKKIATSIKAKTSGCPHFPGRKCRGCKYSSDPDLYDGCCLYGQQKK